MSSRERSGLGMQLRVINIEEVFEAEDLDEIGVGELYREEMRILRNIPEPWGTPVFNGQVGKDEPENRRDGEKQ